MPPVAAPTGSAPSPQAINANARAIVLQRSVPMSQQITSQTIAPSSNPLLNVAPRGVGLVKRFIVEVQATFQNTGAVPVTLNDMGLANILAQVTYTDLNNYQRISTVGLHLALLSSAKRRGPYGGSYAFTPDGNNVPQMFNVADSAWPIFQAPETVAPSTSATLRAVYEVPLAYSDDDLRGAIYSNVVNATQNLGLTVNTNPVAAGAVDSTFAVFTGAAGAAGSFTSVQITVTQEYLDQLPGANGQLILPSLDLSTVYELKNTSLTGITQNQDFFIPYSNMRDFHSVFCIYNNDGSNDGRNFGSDISLWSLRAANMTNLFQYGPMLAAQKSRDELTFDLPAGVYYFPSRKKPISTNAYGNMQLVLNPSVAKPGATVAVFWEDFGLLNTLTGASSLSAN